MKFAKRLASEASRNGAFAAAYFDYRAAKKAIKDDILKSDVAGSNFQKLLEAELQKVSLFYAERADRLEASLRSLHGGGGSGGGVQELMALRAEMRELIKFVALNYLAVVKAIKKRNRHLRETFGAAASISLQALDLLGHELFFTSPRLARLSTEADVLLSGLAAAAAAAHTGHNTHAAAGGAVGANSASGSSCTHGSHAHAHAGHAQPQSHLNSASPHAEALLEEYQCPICLDTLHNPVVLTCAHRFCWGCLVAHVTAAREQALPLSPANAGCKGDSSACSSLQLLERIAAHSEDASEQRFYNCPVCRKPQLLDVDSLSVDPFLSNFIESVKVLSVNGGAAAPAAPPAPAPPPPAPAALALTLQPPKAAAAAPPAPPPSSWGLLPPQRPEHAGRLCVLLDLDGTLVSSYTPRRAPRLPPYVRTHLVGLGSKLNPAGVFVVERPGLREFLEELAGFAEVVVYTAGLEDYAAPIIDAIDPRGNLFAARIYREGTLRTEHYQCVKDMGRLGRPLGRTLLVDDTPLAFLHQPDNGVPVLGFRGDPDDRLLMEAVLPLLQVLSKESDVRPVLRRRFDMATWFRRNSFPIDAIVAEAAAAARREREQHLGAASLSRSPSYANDAPTTSSSSSGSAAASPAVGTRYAFCCPRASAPAKRFCLLTDFDKTLTDCDAGEAVVEQLAPELLPMLHGLGPAESYIPITNTILGEMQRRGVSRDALLTTLQQLGAEMPLASCELLRMMAGAGIDVKVLSDANAVFIGHILAGAKIAGCVGEVITNPASFERVAGEEQAGAAATAAASALQRSAGHRLHIRPHFNPQDPDVVLPGVCSAPQPTAACSGGCCGHRSSGSSHATGAIAAAAGAKPCSCCSASSAAPARSPSSGATPAAHGCPRCPDNLCKGLEVQRLRHANTYSHIIYCGDGANDVCAALSLGPDDVVLARSGHPLAAYITEAQGNPGLPRVEAQVAFWSTHEELLACVRQLVDV